MICSCVTNAVRKIRRGENTEKFESLVVQVRAGRVSKRNPTPSHSSAMYVASTPNFSLLMSL